MLGGDKRSYLLNQYKFQIKLAGALVSMSPHWINVRVMEYCVKGIKAI